MINYVNKIDSMTDVIEFENFKNSVFFVNKLIYQFYFINIIRKDKK